MSFLWCTLSVNKNKMEESIAFYRDIVGLPIDRQTSFDTGLELCFLGDGETKVELICDKTDRGVCDYPNISIGFAVESVDEHISFIRHKGLEVESGPFQPSPHIKFYYLRDPNGVRVQFVETK